jgi:chitin synthase
MYHNQGDHFNGPFDENHARVGTPAHSQSTYSLNETYRADAQAPSYNAPYNGSAGFSGAIDDPTTAFGVPGRIASPYQRSETSSSEAWRERQAPSGNNLKRYATRKVKLVQGTVLSVDYPVPSAIQNAIQAKYRNDLEGGSEEFTHMRCRI